MLSKRLDLSGGTVTVTCAAKSWDGNSSFSVSLLSGQTAMVSVTNKYTVENGFEAKVLSFSAGATNDAVIFSTLSSPADSRRVFLDDIVVTVAAAGAAALAVTPASLSFAALTNEVSAAQTVSLTGQNLDGTALTLTAAAGFEFSLDGGASYAASAVFAVAGAWATNALVRSVASAVVINATGSLTLAGGGAEDAASVALAATVTDGRVEAPLLAWNWFGKNAASNPPPRAADEAALAIVSNTMTFGGTLAASASRDTFGGSNFRSGTAAEAAAADEGIGFSFKVRKGHSVELTKLSYRVGRSGTGPTNGVWQLAIGDEPFRTVGQVLAWTNANAIDAQTVDFSGTGVATSGVTVAVRLLLWGAPAAGGTFYFRTQSIGTDDFALSGYDRRGEEANDPPVMTVVPDVERVVAGESVTFNVVVTDAEGGVIQVAAEGGNLTPEQRLGGGTFVWAPLAAGWQSIRFTASEAGEPENVVATNFLYAVGLAAPTNVVATRLHATAVNLAWDAVPGATGYAVDLFRWLGVTTNVLTEDFSGCPMAGTVYFSTNGLASCSAKMNVGGTCLSGWSGQAVYPAMLTTAQEDGSLVTNSLVRVSTSDAIGWLATPVLDLSRNHGYTRISFDTARWEEDNTNLFVVLQDVATGREETNLVENLSETGLEHRTVESEAGSLQTVIRFEPATTRSGNNRFFLANVQVTGSEARDPIVSNRAVTENQVGITSDRLTSGIRYAGTVRATAGEIISADAEFFDVPEGAEFSALLIQ